MVSGHNPMTKQGWFGECWAIPFSISQATVNGVDNEECGSDEANIYCRFSVEPKQD
jgi:hypothetical protein